jgi:hypothetical protein
MNRKLFKLLSLLSLILLAGFISMQLFVYFWISPVLDSVFTKSVSYYSSELYRVEYADMQVNPYRQSVTFKDFRLNFDSSRVQQTDSLRKRKWVSLQVDDFELSLNNFWTMVPSRFLDVDKLNISRPRLSIFDYGQQSKDDSLSLDKIRQFDAHALISQYFDSLVVSSLSIDDAGVGWIKSDPEQESFDIAGISARVEGLRINSGTVNRNYGYPEASVFELKLEDASFTSRDSLYAFQVKGITADPVRQELMVDSFSMLPLQSEYRFARDVGHRVDRISLQVEKLMLERIDLHYLISEQAFLVGKITIVHPLLEVFKDKRMQPPLPAPKPMLQESLKLVPVAFRLDSLLLVKGNIQYREHAPDADKPGNISFQDVYMSAYNISNIDSLWKRELMMEADVETIFMGQSLLKLNMDFPLHRKDQLHRISGEMRELSLPSLNNMLENTAFASVESGHVFTLKFDMQLDSHDSRGEMQFAYRDLKIKLLSKENPDDPSLKENIKSLLANWLVVKSNNPDNHTKPLRIGEIAFVRDPEKSFFNYWWKSLLSGIKGSVGMGESHSSARNEEEKNQEKEKEDGFFRRLFGKEKPGRE